MSRTGRQVLIEAGDLETRDLRGKTSFNQDSRCHGTKHGFFKAIAAIIGLLRPR